ncbi:MAG: lysine--tRNA ligase [Diaphorobacter nitroreducens]|uniref:lysine--tRNA ligase n=1 Tax=Diaphorobacter TaxID=238749 RepID=UPI0000ED0EA0|nr:MULTISPECIES: lysine--tRNA ligase [Diaphorobacter]ABM43373.1 lysyl-tRNA synthetase [Acidovorax sp. JS42]PZU42781.1 MAG: lysine--tRNA ligase [Acidovorax sp.]TFI48935.1 lysine--tRNA ligase [Diaphorobacter sp. DS2]UOB06709.1 lysine--tRNA ligase [Diaphorobacter sp. LI3]KLR57543.1 lysyl-tRNA synthetase [Diaphorobacter sp. J5-51]
MSTEATPAPAPQDENQLIAERREKLKALRENQAQGQGVAFPNDYKPQHHAAVLQQQYGTLDGEALEAQAITVSVAGRMMLKRVMGKASFATLQDGSLGDTGGRIQLYVTRDAIGEEAYSDFKRWDLGDILGAEGTLMKTKTGELSVKVSRLRLLTKSLRPMPDKFHGVADQEVKYRQRYVDLMTDEAARRRFVARSKAVGSIRSFMMEHGFLEVETPMLHPIPGGANAKPFVTHHNALEQEMFLRIAPELYLKRLIVGGFERVFEINRNFRNEGISVRHNPEFTMMEFYAAYWNYRDLMDFTEALVRDAALKATGTLQLTYGGRAVDLAQPFQRLTIREAIYQHTEAGAHVDDAAWLISALKKLGMTEEKDRLSTRTLASLQVLYFEEEVEDKLWQPTFIMEHPTEISPLARANDLRPEVTERFELYITGREFGNGFSELNDAEDQAARFHAQVAAKDAGDDEAMFFDHDFVRALEYGMPPTGGCGIGIDRLMMLLTDSPSIRDVILFPALRREH